MTVQLEPGKGWGNVVETDRVIKDSSGNVLGRILKLGQLIREADHGATFLTMPHEDIQLGVLKHQAGREITPHVHNPMTRTVEGTTEVLLLLKGRMSVAFYSATDWELQTYQVYAGDVVMLLGGGHGFTVHEDVEVLELRQGPYLGRDKEKRDIV
jgi:hypothetical protein